MMLGVRRAGVTTALHELESKGLISTSRGSLNVVDRDDLKKLLTGSTAYPKPSSIAYFLPHDLLHAGQCRQIEARAQEWSEDGVTCLAEISTQTLSADYCYAQAVTLLQRASTSRTRWSAPRSSPWPGGCIKIALHIIGPRTRGRSCVSTGVSPYFLGACSNPATASIKTCVVGFSSTGARGHCRNALYRRPL